MLRHRILDLAPHRLGWRAIDWYWRRLETELAWLPTLVRADSVVIDIGAWRGPWTRALARVARRVHAFEPQPRLARAIRLTTPANVTVHEIALSDGPPGEARLWMPAGQAGLDALATLRDGRSSREVQREGTIEEIDVATAPLDSFGFGDVSFVKIDVEGHEAAVLAGAASTIEANRPRLLVEIEQRHLSEPIDTVFDWLSERGYAGWFLRQGAWSPLADFDVERDQLALVEDPRSVDYVNNFLFTEPEMGL